MAMLGGGMHQRSGSDLSLGGGGMGAVGVGLEGGEAYEHAVGGGGVWHENGESGVDILIPSISSELRS